MRVLALLLLLPAVLAADIQVYSVIFDVQQDMKVKEEIKIVFNESLEQTKLTYILSGDAYNIKANNSIEEIRVEREGESLVLFVPKGSRQIYLSFETSELVKNYNDGKEFLTYMHVPKAKLTKLQLLLPKGYAFYKDGVMPPGEMGTDGERIFVSWKDVERETALMARFYKTEQSRVELLLAAALIAAALIVWAKSRQDESYLLGFSNDEIKVIEAVKAKRIVYQNKLEKELGFSRAKMTRIIKKLEEKGLVQKEKIGRTNKIRWL